jgi:hypothetical protein
MFEIVRNCGMKTILMVLANDGFADTPKEFRATNTKRAFFGCEICPSVIGGMNRILDNHRLQASWFENIDAVLFWPYDEGGCGCDKCAPWGGHAMFAEGLRKYIANAFPRVKLSILPGVLTIREKRNLKLSTPALTKARETGLIMCFPTAMTNSINGN